MLKEKNKIEKKNIDAYKKYRTLGKMHDMLLKKIIPFIKIVHLPRGHAQQIRGPYICVPASVNSSLNALLPFALSVKLLIPSIHLPELAALRPPPARTHTHT